MQRLNVLFAVIAVAIIGLSLNAAQHHASRRVTPVALETGAEKPTDPILESFMRELDRKPSTYWRPRRDAIDDDVLYDALNTIHWTRPTESTGQPISLIEEEAE